MCYIVFISDSLHWRYTSRKYVIIAIRLSRRHEVLNCVMITKRYLLIWAKENFIIVGSRKFATKETSCHLTNMRAKMRMGVVKYFCVKTVHTCTNYLFHWHSLDFVKSPQLQYSIQTNGWYFWKRSTSELFTIILWGSNFVVS